ncbi:MAG: CoA transferase [Acidobacteria bacterium]|nr:CoA transferase [Acidobacteriota bacterium]
MPAPPAAVDVTGHAGHPRSLADCTIADLSALWAGPLCSGLLGRGGARVVKVETAERPDRARHGNRRLWRLLNGNKEDRTVDRTRLRDEIDAADIVVLSSRRRAYEQLGIDVDDVLRARTDKVVVAITGHGWRDDRVGFGDDAAVAGGLVARHPVDGAPRFLADAIADPLTGLHAAVAAARCATAGGQWFVDAALARVSGAMAAVACAHEPALAATRRRRGWVLETAEGDWPVAPPRARAT